MALKECRPFVLVVWTATAVACSGSVPQEAAEPLREVCAVATPAAGGGDAQPPRDDGQPATLDCVTLSEGVSPPRRTRYRKAELPQELATVRMHGGVLVYHVTIGVLGDVTNVKLARPIDPVAPWPTLAEAWRSAILGWSYEPTTVYGKPVPVCMTATVTVDVR